MKRFCLTHLLLIFCGVGLQAQSTIEGFIYDAETMKPIPFAEVFLSDTSAPVLTDENGMFRLEGVAEGDYTLMAKSADFDNSYRLTTCPGVPTKMIYLERKARLRHDAKVLGPLRNRHIFSIYGREMRKLPRIKTSLKEWKKMKRDMKEAFDRM